MTCEKCGYELQIGDFPFCKGKQEDHGRGTNARIGDEIDVWVKHGLCNADGSPRHFTSREHLAKVAKAQGYTNYVVHVDGSKHTSRWV